MITSPGLSVPEHRREDVPGMRQRNEGRGQPADNCALCRAEELSPPMNTHEQASKALEKKTECCGDPKKLDGGAHPWVYLGEDDQGMHYACPECGAVDSD